MNSNDLHHIRTASAQRSAQLAFDSMAEPDGDERIGAIREAIRVHDEYMARADRSLDSGNVDAALDHLGCAMRELGEVATMEAV